MQFYKKVIAKGLFFELFNAEIRSSSYLWFNALNIRAFQTKLVSFRDEVCWYDLTHHP